MDVFYRKSSGEVDFIGIISTGAPGRPYDPGYFDELSDPPFTDGTQYKPKRVLGSAKINDSGTIRNATQNEIDTFAGLELDDKNQRQADTAVEYFQNDPQFRRIMTAFASILVDEFNILRSEHGLADRTLSQLKTAIVNRISKDD